MKIMSQLVLVLTATLTLNAYAESETAKSTMPAKMPKKEMMKPSIEYSAAMDDIKSSLGMVPTFLKMYPQAGLPGAWEEMKSVQLNPNSMISGKHKELIGLAVSSQIPCKYCVYFHKKFAALNGASEAEINEAIAVASMVRKWSTYAYGQNLDFENFKKDVSQMVSRTKEQMQKNTPAPVAMRAADITTADAAMKDVQNLWGFTPAFISEYHKPSMPGAWKSLRDFHMSNNTALPMKVKGFIGLAVGSQMPCNYCVHIDSEFAKLDGATADELKEAVQMSAQVRHWSTFLNGLSQDDNQFRREVDQLVGIARRKMSGVKTDRQASVTQ